LPVRREHFGADGNDFGFHKGSNLLLAFIFYPVGTPTRSRTPHGHDGQSSQTKLKAKANG
jgi:hypothetical protein